MAVGRYDGRRAAVVDDANAIGTTYLRAQTLREPIRSQSLADLVHYTDASIRLSHAVPGSKRQRAAIADEDASNASCGGWPARRSPGPRRTARRASMSTA